MNFVLGFEERKNKFSPTLKIMILEMTMN
jgi:hypothetical protein